MERSMVPNCTLCRGEGEVEIDLPDDRTGWRVCWRCHGTGEQR